jgi:hypothetical protein
METTGLPLRPDLPIEQPPLNRFGDVRRCASASARMSPTQRRWFASMRADVAWHGDLNEARVARQLQKTRSAASLAKRALRRIIKRELKGEDP